MPRKPVAEMTDAELQAEWQGGMYLDCQIGLTEAQEVYHRDIEREMDRRDRECAKSENRQPDFCADSQIRQPDSH